MREQLHRFAELSKTILPVCENSNASQAILGAVAAYALSKVKQPQHGISEAL